MPVAGAEFARQSFGQDFGRDDVGADGNNFLPQCRSRRTRVAAGADEDVRVPAKRRVKW